MKALFNPMTSHGEINKEAFSSVFTIVIIFTALVREGSESHNYIFLCSVIIITKRQSSKWTKARFLNTVQKDKIKKLTHLHPAPSHF